MMVCSFLISVDSSTEINLSILIHDKFFLLFSVLLAIASLLLHPNAEEPADEKIASMFLNNKEEFNRQARECTQRFATVQQTQPIVPTPQYHV